jgi:hypothetical protein
MRYSKEMKSVRVRDIFALGIAAQFTIGKTETTKRRLKKKITGVSLV